MAGAIDWVLTLQQADGRQRNDRGGQEARAPTLRRRGGGALEGVRVAAASDAARASATRLGSSRRSAPRWSRACPASGKKSTADRELAIQQIVSRAVVSTEIVDIMKAAGLEKPRHLNSVGRVPRRGARDREEEPRYRGAEESSSMVTCGPSPSATSPSRRRSRSGWKRPSPAITPTPSRRRRCSKN